MQFNSFIATSILAFAASAAAWTEEDYNSLYAREAGLVDSDYGYEYDLYSREAQPEPEFEFEIDSLHPRDAFEYGLYVGELQSRSPAPLSTADQKKKDMKTYAADSAKQDALKAEEAAKRATLKKAQSDLRSTKDKEKKNNAELKDASKRLGVRSLYDWEW